MRGTTMWHVMRSLLFVLVLLCGAPVRGWWWPFSTAQETGTQQHSPYAEDGTSAAQRSCKFTAPVDVSAKRDVILSRESRVSECRYELAKTLVDDLDICRAQQTLRTVARIATICHYHTSERTALLPQGCHHDSCTKLMNAEVFQVFTSFYLHAESICRELNAQLWMESVESLVQDLGMAGQDTLTLLERMREESEEQSREQKAIAESLLDGLQDVSLQQAVHFTRELEFFNSSTEAIRVQEASLRGISDKLGDLHVALGAFDDITALLLELQQSHQLSSAWILLRVMGFHIVFFTSLRVASALLDNCDSTSTMLRQVHVSAIHVSLLLEIGYVSFSVPIDSLEAWNARAIVFAACHSTCACILLLRAVLACTLRGLPGRSLIEDAAVQDLVQDIIWLKMHIPTSTLEKWVFSRTLRRLLEAPPSGYRHVDPLVDDESLPIAWYSTASEHSHYNRPRHLTQESNVFDEKQAMDSAHCIVALD